MNELSPDTTRILAELRPVLLSIAADTVASALRQVETTYTEPGEVQSIDIGTGRAIVRLDSQIVTGGTIEVDLSGAHPAAGDRVFVEIRPPHGPVLVGRVAGTPNLLAYVPFVAPVGLTSVAVPLVTASAVVQANRLIEISCKAPQVDDAGGSAVVTGYVDDGATYQAQIARVSVGRSLQGSVILSASDVASLAFRFMAAVDAGAATAQASDLGSVPGPGWIKIADIGSALAF